MGAVATGMTWASHKTAIKAYCNVDGTTYDTVLEAVFNAAVAKADTYLNNPFEELRPAIKLASLVAGDSVTVGLGRLVIPQSGYIRERYMNVSTDGDLALDGEDSLVYTAAAAADEDALEFKIEATDTLTADNLVALINSTTLGGSYGAVGVPHVTATNSAGTITLTKRYPNVKDIVVTSSSDTRLLVRWVRTSLSVPAEVTQWVYQYIFRHFRNPGALINEAVTGISSQSWSSGGGAGSVGMADNYDLIAQYRLAPGF
ncbi:MAG: hypothetical protein LLG08_04015 [Actinomycetia bacterium]|nr:hypothetical protein [Actinomycetes bacterium]